MISVLERQTSPRPARQHRLVTALAGVDWLRWEVASVAVFHGLVGAIIALAPEDLVVTNATEPIFFYLHRPGMAAYFLVVAAAAIACWARPTPLRQVLTWLGVVMLGFGWIAGFVLAIRAGQGGLYGVIVWATLLALWTSTAVRLGLRSEA